MKANVALRASACVLNRQRARSSHSSVAKKLSHMALFFATRDNGCDAARECRQSIGLAVISLVRHRNARTDVWSDVERSLELCAVAGLATGQVEVERVAVEIGL